MGWDGPVTHRQFLAWMSWMDEQWDMPTRTDYYLMQIDNSVKRVLSRSPNKIKLEHSKLVFKQNRKKQESNLTKEQVSALSKAKWVGLMTMPVENKTITQQEAEALGLVDISTEESNKLSDEPLGTNKDMPSSEGYSLAAKYSQASERLSRSSLDD